MSLLQGHRYLNFQGGLGTHLPSHHPSVELQVVDEIYDLVPLVIVNIYSVTFIGVSCLFSIQTISDILSNLEVNH